MANRLDLAAVEPGLELPPLVKNPTTRQLVMWAGASGDYNPIHYDKDFATSRHLPGVVVHGQLVSAFLSQLVAGWAGERASLKRLSVSYKSMNYPGQMITCRGMVTGTSLEEGRLLISLSVWAENPAGEKTVVGNAVLEAN